MERIEPGNVENEMAYIVVYQRANGSSAVESCSDLSSAVEAAERLRNTSSVERPRIFETSEIRYDFQPYYRVKVIDPKATTTLGLAAGGMEPAFTFGEVVDVERDTPSAYERPVFDEVDYVDESFDEPIFDEPPYIEGDPEGADLAGIHIDSADIESDLPQQLEGQGSIDDHVAPIVDEEPVPAYQEVPAPEEFAPESVDQTVETVGTGDEYVRAVEPEPVDAPAVEPVAMAAPEVSGVAAEDDVLDLTDSALAGQEAPVTPPAEPQKPGLFEKFVKSLEGSNTSGPAASATDAIADPSEIIEDVGGSVNPRRGLFGK